MAKVILICGKIASGKSFYAKQLKDKEKAVILNIDELTYDLFDNEQDDKYEERTYRAKKYLMKKAVELATSECSVILDWGFWDAKTRSDITKYFEYNNINVEWHYIDIKDTVWNKNIEKRNKKVKEGNGGSDFYVTEELKSKVLSMFEVPSKEEIDIWYKL